MPTQRDLDMLKALPLELKIEKSKVRIREWYYKNNGQVYVSFSGGKDSTVLLHLVRSEFPDVVAVFSDTGLEYPEIKEFIKTIPNVEWLKPKMSFLQVIEKYGYPVISKEVSEMIYQVHQYKESNPKLIEKRMNGIGKNKVGKIPEIWKPLLNADFKISNKCCNVLKKAPFAKFERERELKPIVGTMTEESRQRKQSWLKHGCNAFDSKRPISLPISFWSEEDIWEYIKLNNIEYSKIYDMGYKRTGCVYCLYGCQKEKEGEGRFERMKITHPQLYKYVIENMKIGDILKKVNELCGTNIKY